MSCACGMSGARRVRDQSREMSGCEMSSVI